MFSKLLEHRVRFFFQISIYLTVSYTRARVCARTLCRQMTDSPLCTYNKGAPMCMTNATRWIETTVYESFDNNLAAAFFPIRCVEFVIQISPHFVYTVVPFVLIIFFN